MLNLLQSFIDILTTLVNFVINTITSFLILLTNLPSYTSFIINSINVLPNILIPFATISISLYVILFILGRNS